MDKSSKKTIDKYIQELTQKSLAPMDLLPHSDFREKCIDLVFNGIPENTDQATAAQFHALRRHLVESRVESTRIVVFGGGSGLSNIIGGDSRLSGWSQEPFCGLKEIFPYTRSIVCVTDDGGSTGELIKDLPFIALGDIRHVLLSSIQLRMLQRMYELSYREAQQVVASLSKIFNHRFRAGEISSAELHTFFAVTAVDLPPQLHDYLARLKTILLQDKRLATTLDKAHCLGNLLLAASIYSHLDPTVGNIELEENLETVSEAIYTSLSQLAELMGACENAVLPCTSTPAQLRICYTNGIQATGEYKSSSAVRGYPVDRVIVDFSDKVIVHEQVLKDIAAADIIILAPGSLYSSIIPIFQVPGIAEAVRSNKRALKMLISNLWVQAGETDIAISDPERKFHVSDMIRAYERNIPGGISGLFREVLCLSLKEVPASVLQNYALEGKIPIYLDKKVASQQGFIPIECGIYSKKALAERGVIQHDPELLAQAVKSVYVSHNLIGSDISASRLIKAGRSVIEECQMAIQRTSYPSKKYRILKEIIFELPIDLPPDIQDKHIGNATRNRIIEIIWKHQDIPLTHFEHIKGIVCIDKKMWLREQIWDKVFSFFDPTDSCMKIRSDQLTDPRNLEIAILIAIGQSLLGNYAEKKGMEEVRVKNEVVGKIYHLYLRKPEDMVCHFNMAELDQYLKFARMFRPDRAKPHYSRLINGMEGFTPPGVLMGLTYAWYLDNRLASHIEYKMALMKISKSDLIPEQLKMLARRDSLIHFFREIVFSK